MNLHGANLLIPGGRGRVGRAVGRRLAMWIFRHEDAGERINR